MKPRVALLDYGAGNLRSAQRALERVGAEVTLTDDPKIATEADGLVVPGVGAFASCMEGFSAINGPRIIGQRLAGGRPVLGICVGMQILFDSGDEHGVLTRGCGEWPGKVERLKSPVLPHMGWNTVARPKEARPSRMFAGIDEDERFYFVHSFAARRWELETDGRTEAPLVFHAEYGERFVAAVENGPLWATQFHPEKSGDNGARLLSNWIETL